MDTTREHDPDEQAATRGARLRHVEVLHRATQLIRAYRVRGHRRARVDPLELSHAAVPELDPALHGLQPDDLDRRLPGVIVHAEGEPTLREVIARLEESYCRSIGVQYMHIDELDARLWLEERIERTRNRIELPRDTQLRILRRLTDAVVFEGFVRRKFVAAKSFSLEGCETLIPLLDLAIEEAAGGGAERIVMAMAHRGRLNVLANILGKGPRRIFREFDDPDPELHRGSGDVKYHLGYSGEWSCASGRTVQLSLCFNPSHLEYVNPVALGMLRAWQDREGDLERARAVAVLIHGDASFAGEGIVQETLNLSQLNAYRTGGALHVIVNNQIGYTTPPEEGRSSTYATDVAKMLQIPIFHVNGEDPEAVAQVVHLATEFRRAFRRDVIIDLFGYRRLGHNEGDEPAFTQPLMYAAIEQRPSVRQAYLERMLRLGSVAEEEAATIERDARERLARELKAARARGAPADDDDASAGPWFGGPADQADRPDTAVAEDTLRELLEAQTRLPDDFHPHLKIERAIGRRLEMARGERPLDWSAAESLAFASLATEGVPVRLTGQDSARGTFSQRHAELHDVENGCIHVPLRHVAVMQAPVDIRNSPLSEAGVLGFEYGYSLAAPDALVMWEAQYGDFANAAQVVVDQFIASGEDKWAHLSGLVMLLPHGYDGQGPEHSSARLERFLALAAEDNIQVAVPSTPAQFFHLLRRQALRRWRKPLIVLTPKSLLRDPRAGSSLAELATGGFREVLPDAEARLAAARRVLLCAGQVGYDLAGAIEEAGRDDVAVVRVEQLHPFPEQALRDALAPCPPGASLVWVQEEPLNMGAWPRLARGRDDALFGPSGLRAVGRPESASPATGSKASHEREQAELIERALG